MGNCLVSQSADPYPSTTTGPPTPGTSSSYSARFSRVVSQDIFSSGERSLVPHLRMYNFLDLKIATGNFKPGAVLGEGDFGSTVFKGWVDEKTLTPCTFGSGMIVAVKKLTPENSLGFQEWVSDVRVLGRLSHPNLVKLLGYCWEDKELLLVYEFVQKGSLADHLFGRSTSREPLSWDIRLKIAIGAARGLAFLHALEKLVIYRDLKPSNILLDGNYNAKLSDNGLAALGHSSGNSCVETPVRGTYGYAAPEYLATGHFYVTSDVYGFGVVLLELLTGQRALDTKRPDGQHNLVDWLKPTLSRRRKLKSIMDSRIKGQYSADAAFQAAQLTLKCLESEPEKRPSMREVEEELEKIESIKGKKLRNQNLKP